MKSFGAGYRGRAGPCFVVAIHNAITMIIEDEWYQLHEMKTCFFRNKNIPIRPLSSLLTFLSPRFIMEERRRMVRLCSPSWMTISY